MDIIAQEVQRYYMWLMGIAGFIGLVMVVIAGMRYITSAGNPSQRAEAKEQIKSVIWGLAILLTSWILLRTINPRFIDLDSIGQLPPLPDSPLQLPSGQSYVPDVLKNLEESVNIIQTSSQAILFNARALLQETKGCDCQYTAPVCLCRGGSASDQCEAKACFSKNDYQPCPSGPLIKTNQQRLIAFGLELLYYKNRIMAEEKDVQITLDNLTKNIDYWQQKIRGGADAPLMAAYQREKSRAAQEKMLRNELIKKIPELADLIYNDAANEGMSPLTQEIAPLPDQCQDLSICLGSCKVGQNLYGCHDRLLGCQPDKCGGGNPCPVGKIDGVVKKIEDKNENIINKCGEILFLIKNINNTRAISL